MRLGELEALLEELKLPWQQILQQRKATIPIYASDKFLSEGQVFTQNWPPKFFKKKFISLSDLSDSDAYGVEIGREFLSGYVQPGWIAVVNPHAVVQENDLVFVVNKNGMVEIKNYEEPRYHRTLKEKGEHKKLQELKKTRSKDIVHKIVLLIPSH